MAYVSAPSQKAHRPQPGTIDRVSDEPLNGLVLEHVGRLAARSMDWSALTPLLHRVELRPDEVRVTVAGEILGEAMSRHAIERAATRLANGDRLMPGDETLTLIIAVRPVFRGGRTWLVKPEGSATPAVTEPDRALVKALAQAHVGLDAHSASPTNKPDDWRAATAVPVADR